MPNSIVSQLIRLRNSYALQLIRVEASDMDSIFKRYAMRQTQQGIDECDRQIAKEEEQGAEPRECSIAAYKRVREREEE